MFDKREDILDQRLNKRLAEVKECSETAAAGTLKMASRKKELARLTALEKSISGTRVRGL